MNYIYFFFSQELSWDETLYFCNVIKDNKNKQDKIKIRPWNAKLLRAL